MHQVVAVQCNRKKFQYYHSIFTKMLCGPICQVTELICAMQDMQTPEIVAAFTASIDRYVLGLEGGTFKPGQLDILSTEIDIIFKLLCHESFGDSNRDLYPAWFYLRWSEFLNNVIKECVHDVNHTSKSLTPTALQVGMQRKTCQTLFAIAKGMRHVLPNDTVQSGTGTFAILVNIACDKSCDMSRSILSAGKYKAESLPSLNWRHAILVDELSKNILAEVPASERTISKWDNSFSFFIGSKDWRQLAERILNLPFRINGVPENMVQYICDFMHECAHVMEKEFQHYINNNSKRKANALYSDLAASYRNYNTKPVRARTKRMREF